jgi:hypothetical protein
MAHLQHIDFGRTTWAAFALLGARSDYLPKIRLNRAARIPHRPKCKRQ